MCFGPRHSFARPGNGRLITVLIALSLLGGPDTGSGSAIGDLDGDGRVAFSDVLLFLEVFGGPATSGSLWQSADLDGDGQIGFADFLLLATLFQTGTAEASDLRVVAPHESGAKLLNPGRGWVTFHSTNATYDADPAGAVAYHRYYWKDLEPGREALALGGLEADIRDAAAEGQQFGFRVMVIDPSGRGAPNWLLEEPVNARHTIGHHLQNIDRDYVIPDANDPVFLQEVERFVRCMAERVAVLDLTAHIAFVDVGLVGVHGEWYLNWNDSSTHWDYLPTQASTRRIIDAVRLAFPQSPCFLSLGAKNAGVANDSTNALTYARDVGVGWRQDAWINPGNPAFPWFEGNQEIIDRFVPDLWKTAPAMVESAFIMRDWGTEDIPMSEAELSAAVDWLFDNHVSLLDDTGNAVPEWIQETDAFQRLITHLGYRLVLRRLAHPEAAAPGDTIAVTTHWENVGSAPPYRDWRLAFRLGPATSPIVTITEVSVSGWLPSSFQIQQGMDSSQSVESMLPIPAGMPTGDHDLSVAIVDAETGLPAIQLGIESAQENGWYPLSHIDVRN